jgi:hypothetical protein
MLSLLAPPHPPCLVLLFHSFFVCVSLLLSLKIVRPAGSKAFEFSLEAHAKTLNSERARRAVSSDPPPLPIAMGRFGVKRDGKLV